eukprot:m.38742 g.38742  ORF g.38742 m.38742 type:complete len:413 (+) comp11519_c0_seq1:1527-2765(+)
MGFAAGAAGTGVLCSFTSLWFRRVVPSLKTRLIVGVQHIKRVALPQGSRKDTPKANHGLGLFGLSHHLADVDHGCCTGITASHGFARSIVHISQIDGLNAMRLCLKRRGKMIVNQGQQSICNGKPCSHELFAKVLEGRVTFLSLTEDNTKLAGQLQQRLKLTLGVCFINRIDGLKRNSAEGALIKAASMVSGDRCTTTCLVPTTRLGIHKSVSPKTLGDGHHFWISQPRQGLACLGDVHLWPFFILPLLALLTSKKSKSQLRQSEAPTVQTTAKTNRAFGRIHREVKAIWLVGFDEVVDTGNGGNYFEVGVFWRELKLRDDTIQLVEEKNRLHILGQSLTNNRFGLNTDAFDTIDNDKCTIRNTKSSRHLSREVSMARTINQVDAQMLLLFASFIRQAMACFPIFVIERNAC